MMAIFYTVCNYKKKLNLIQNSPAVKKRCGRKKKKMWQPRNGCDGRLMAKILITTIQVNLVPYPSEMWRRQHKFTWIVLIKNFAISLWSQPFLGCLLGFHIFFTMDFWGHTVCFTAGLFWIRYLYSINWIQMWNSRWWPRNGCDIRLTAKILIMTIQVNLVPNPSGIWRR